MRVLLFAVAIASLTGCAERRAPPASGCTRLGEQCRTAEGPIGVCNERGGECTDPPCLECMPQH